MSSDAGQGGTQLERTMSMGMLAGVTPLGSPFMNSMYSRP
jgi:hypothetical protein